jgi:hypothetical protein
MAAEFAEGSSISRSASMLTGAAAPSEYNGCATHLVLILGTTARRCWTRWSTPRRAKTLPSDIVAAAREGRLCPEQNSHTIWPRLRTASRRSSC